MAEQVSPVTTLNFDWPQSASEIVRQTKSRSDLVRLIMDGIGDVESWLIAHRIMPLLHEKQLATLGFQIERGREKRSASLMPLPDGSAFACNVLGAWFTLEPSAAAHELEYLGSRYAPSDRWLDGFQATLVRSDGTASPITPTELARMWTEITGARLSGFEVGILDQIETIGYDVADKVFNTQGRLGL